MAAKGDEAVKNGTFHYQPRTNANDKQFFWGLMTPTIADSAREHDHNDFFSLTGSLG